MIDIYVTPPKAENKGNKYILDKENINMPKICSAKENKDAQDFFNDLMKGDNENNNLDFQ